MIEGSNPFNRNVGVIPFLGHTNGFLGKHNLPLKFKGGTSPEKKTQRWNFGDEFGLPPIDPQYAIVTTRMTLDF